MSNHANNRFDAIMAKTTQARGKTMKRRLTASVLFASLAVAPLAGIPASTANAQSVISPPA